MRQWSGWVTFPVPKSGVWPRHGHLRGILDGFQDRQPNFHKWARPACEQGALPTLSLLPGKVTMRVVPGDKIYQAMEVETGCMRPAILHGFGTSAKQRLPGRLAELAQFGGLPLGGVVEQIGPNQEVTPLPSIYFFDAWRVEPELDIPTELPRARTGPEEGSLPSPSSSPRADQTKTREEEARDLLVGAIKNQAEVGPSRRKAAIRAYRYLHAMVTQHGPLIQQAYDAAKLHAARSKGRPCGVVGRAAFLTSRTDYRWQFDSPLVRR